VREGICKEGKKEKRSHNDIAFNWVIDRPTVRGER